jgi:menaquinone-dependent protoporphyrinogen oxidase
MRVLVAVASKHGATREIAEAVGRTLESSGVEATVTDAGEVETIAGYDAFVVGSAVYMGRWLKEAQALVDDHADTLVSHPTWLFSSGPIGAPPKPDDAHAVDVTDIVSSIRPRGHRLFAGKVDRNALGFGERAVMLAVRSPDGDFRDWDEIDGWARSIAAALTS